MHPKLIDSVVISILAVAQLLGAVTCEAHPAQSRETPKPRVTDFAPKVNRTAIVSYGVKNDSILKLAPSLTADVAKSIVQIQKNNAPVSLGTIVSSDGHILTMTDSLRGDLSVSIGGKQYPFEIVGIHRGMGLAMLKIEANDLPAVELKQVKDMRAGNWLFTPGPKNQMLAAGVFAGWPKTRVLFLGVNLASANQAKPNRSGVKIQNVVRQSPADKADLLLNDVVLAIDGIEVNSVQELQDAIKGLEPFEWVEILISRDGKQELVEVEMNQHRGTGQFSGRQKNAMLNKRRSYFWNAFQHDSHLTRKQCGGPVVDSSGQVVGINVLMPIRRPIGLAITPNDSSLALAVSMNEILPVINALKHGELAPKAINKHRINSLQSELAETENLLNQDWQEQVRELSGKIKRIEASSQTLVSLKQQLQLLKRKIGSAKQRHRKIQQELNNLKNGFGN